MIGTENIHQEDEGKRLIREELLADMRANPGSYSGQDMQFLFDRMMTPEDLRSRNNPMGRFLRANMRLSIEDLRAAKILPEGSTELEEAMFKDNAVVPQCSIKEVGMSAEGRTDVYLLGHTGSGHSSMLAGMLTCLSDQGIVKYVPNVFRGQDLCKPYYEMLVSGLKNHKIPIATGKDVVSFMQFNIGPRHHRKVTFVEFGAGTTHRLSRASLDNPGVWTQEGIGRCLKNDNRKVLVFLLDYGKVLGKDPHCSEIEQAEILENLLHGFSTDGLGKYGEKHCIMSKVKSVAVVVNKSDLMEEEAGKPLTREERMEVAKDYIQRRFRSFMVELSDQCKNYGINASNQFRPYVSVFSLGKFYVGNTVAFDPTDSQHLLKFLVKTA